MCSFALTSGSAVLNYSPRATFIYFNTSLAFALDLHMQCRVTMTQNCTKNNLNLNYFASMNFPFNKIIVYIKNTPLYSVYWNTLVVLFPGYFKQRELLCYPVSNDDKSSTHASWHLYIKYARKQLIPRLF